MSGTAPGIFCLEGEWESRLTDRRSVEPLLQVIENLDLWGRVIHRDVATREEFEYYATKWTRRQYDRYPLGYFSFHGEPSRVRLGKDSLTLNEMAEILRGGADGRVIYFGSCQTLAASDEDLQRFCQVSGARAVVGYTRRIDWLESAAFDLILLPHLLDSEYMKPIYTRLCRDHPRFVEGLGLRMASSSWSTPRKIALDVVRQRRRAPDIIAS
jgi:hypothetical protein